MDVDGDDVGGDDDDATDGDVAGGDVDTCVVVCSYAVEEDSVLWGSGGAVEICSDVGASIAGGGVGAMTGLIPTRVMGRCG